VPQVKLSASKEELELRNEIKEEKNTDNLSKVNSKTQNNNKLCLSGNRKIMSIKSIAAKLFAQKSIRKHKLGPLTLLQVKKLFLQD
jgi:hypothetical protein